MSCILRRTHEVDFDGLDEDSPTFSIVSSALGKEINLLAMTWSSFKPLVPDRNMWRFWATSSFEGWRFCPLCVHDDAQPYLRLIWRLKFMVACTRHSVLLASKCSNCGAKQGNRWLRSKFLSLEKCYRCGYPLEQTPIEPLERGNLGLAAMRDLAELLSGNLHPKEIGWGFRLREFFRTFKFVYGFVRLVRGPKSELTASPKCLFRVQDSSQGLSLLEETWCLIRDQDKLGDFIRTNQTLFDRYSYRTDYYEGHYPKSLQRYRTPRFSVDLNERSDRILGVILEHQKSASDVKYRKIAHTLGIPEKTVGEVIKRETRLREAFGEARLAFERRRIEAVTHALATLESQDEYPSFAKLRTLVGLHDHQLQDGMGEFPQKERELVRKAQVAHRANSIGRLKQIMEEMPWGEYTTFSDLAGRIHMPPLVIISDGAIMRAVRSAFAHTRRRDGDRSYLLQRLPITSGSPIKDLNYEITSTLDWWAPKPRFGPRGSARVPF